MKYQKEEPDEIYDVMRENPEIIQENQRKKKKASPHKKVSGRKISMPKADTDDSKDSNVFTDPGNNEFPDGVKSNYIFEDKDSEIAGRDVSGDSENEIPTEQYLESWRNEAAEKKNEEALKRSFEYRKKHRKTFSEKNTGRIRGVLIFCAIIICVFAIYSIVSDVYLRIHEKYVPTGDAEIENYETIDPHVLKGEKNTDKNGQYTIEGVANAVENSIVDIKCYATQSALADNNPNENASGIIISSDGYIATNSHVLEKSKFVTVETKNGDKYNAEIVGSDSRHDLAVLKINATSLTPAELGNSKKISVGENVVAIGNPGGFSGSVTNGIISGLKRNIESTGMTDLKCIQTNAAINPGNSGGALCNMYGQVIGITTTKYSGEDYEGMGFAIPINDALPILKELTKATYNSNMVSLGISFISVNDDDSRQAYKEDTGITLPNDFSGLLITSINRGSNAEKTDLKENDFIIGVNGTPVKDYDDIHDALEDYDGNSEIRLDCISFDKDANRQSYTVKFVP